MSFCETSNWDNTISPHTTVLYIPPYRLGTIIATIDSITTHHIEVRCVPPSTPPSPPSPSATPFVSCSSSINPSTSFRPRPFNHVDRSMNYSDPRVGIFRTLSFNPPSRQNSNSTYTTRPGPSGPSSSKSSNVALPETPLFFHFATDHDSSSQTTPVHPAPDSIHIATFSGRGVNHQAMQLAYVAPASSYSISSPWTHPSYPDFRNYTTPIFPTVLPPAPSPRIPSRLGDAFLHFPPRKEGWLLEVTMWEAKEHKYLGQRVRRVRGEWAGRKVLPGAGEKTKMVDLVAEQREVRGGEEKRVAVWGTNKGWELAGVAWRKQEVKMVVIVQRVPGMGERRVPRAVLEREKEMAREREMALMQEKQAAQMMKREMEQARQMNNGQTAWAKQMQMTRSYMPQKSLLKNEFLNREESQKGKETAVMQEKRAESGWGQYGMLIPAGQKPRLRLFEGVRNVKRNAMVQKPFVQRWVMEKPWLEDPDEKARQ